MSPPRLRGPAVGVVMPSQIYSATRLSNQSIPFPPFSRTRVVEIHHKCDSDSIWFLKVIVWEIKSPIQISPKIRKRVAICDSEALNLYSPKPVTCVFQFQSIAYRSFPSRSLDTRHVFIIDAIVSLIFNFPLKIFAADKMKIALCLAVLIAVAVSGK